MGGVGVGREWGEAVVLLLQFVFRVDVEALTPHRLSVQRLDHLVRLQPLLEETETEGQNGERRIRYEST